MNLTARTVDGIARIGAQQWQGLDTRGNPFVSWAFLHSLEATGSVAAANGWQPHHLCLYDGDRLLAAAPGYIKSHSRGEFVFDWAWADAYHRNQFDYYPKLLTAVPWTPVSGPRLLTVRDHPQTPALRRKLVEFGLERCAAMGLSSWHCNFIETEELEAFEQAGLLARHDWQFHWYNRGFGDFDEFLATLKSRKRKKIRQERRQVSDSGVIFQRLPGGDLDDDTIAFLHRCYQRTFLAHGNLPALSLECFRQLFATMPDRLLAVIARDGGAPLAMALFFIGSDALFGRYWGTLEDRPGLHFETAYYQGIEFCIEQGLRRFESGAQGEHKIARGFEPVRTRSFHHIAHAGFRAAIAQYLEHEAGWLDDYRVEIEARQPFRVVSRG